MPYLEKEIERFLSFTKQENTCLIWVGYRHSKNGSPLFSVGGRKVQARRFSWEVWKGVIPKNVILENSCGNRNCVNSEHLQTSSYASVLMKVKKQYAARNSRNAGNIETLPVSRS